MRKTATALAALGMVAMLAAAAPAIAQNLMPVAVSAQTETGARRTVADLWLRQISNDKNLDGDRTTYYLSVYRKQGPQGEEHRIVGPRPVGEWHLSGEWATGPSIADRLIRADFRGDTRYVVRLTHGDGSA